MNSLKVVNLFTYVVLFFSAVSFWPEISSAQSSRGTENREDCTARKVRELSAGCSSRPTDDAKLKCRELARSNAEEECSIYRSRSEEQARNGECNSLYERVLSEAEEAEAECGKAGWGSLSACRTRAATCGNSMSLDPASDENMTQGINNLMSAWMTTQGVQSGASGANPCTIVDQKATQQKRERIEDQISRLQEQNQDSVTKQADLDDEFSKRQEETEDKIREAEEDVEKKKIERQTKMQEENTRIQKAVLASQKKQFDNLNNINKKNIEIANLQFAQQQINIEMSDLRMNKTCRDKVQALSQALLWEDSTAARGSGAPTGNKRLKKMTIKEAQKMKQDLKLEETTCLQVESLKRTAQLKGLFDKRAGLQAEVDTLTRANEDEAKAIEIEKKSFEELKLTMDKEEKTDAENKFKKLNTLSASLARFKDTIDKKKKSQQDRIALREQQIQRLVLSKNEVVVKELDVNSKIKNATRQRDSFADRCCSTVGGAVAHTSCTREMERKSSGSKREDVLN